MKKKRITAKQEQLIAHLSERLAKAADCFDKAGKHETYLDILKKTPFYSDMPSKEPQTTKQASKVIEGMLAAVELLSIYWKIFKYDGKNISDKKGNIKFVLLPNDDYDIFGDWWREHVDNSLIDYFNSVSEREFIRDLENEDLGWQYIFPYLRVNDVADNDDMMEFVISDKYPDGTYEIDFLSRMKG